MNKVEANKALKEFAAKVLVVTGREVKSSEISRFVEQYETLVAHKLGRIVQISFCDFQTLSGRAQTVEVAVFGL